MQGQPNGFFGFINRFVLSACFYPGQIVKHSGPIRAKFQLPVPVINGFANPALFIEGSGQEVKHYGLVGFYANRFGQMVDSLFGVSLLEKSGFHTI